MPPPKKPEADPGTLPDNRIPVYDHKGRMRGQVGPKATSVTVTRFVGQHGAHLGKKDGRTAWIGPKPPPKPKPQPNPANATPGAMPGAPGGDAGKQSHTLEISLKAAKGSVSDKPKKPEAHAPATSGVSHERREGPRQRPARRAQRRRRSSRQASVVSRIAKGCANSKAGLQPQQHQQEQRVAGNHGDRGLYDYQQGSRCPVWVHSRC